jgi:hypothetical protein
MTKGLGSDSAEAQGSEPNSAMRVNEPPKIHWDAIGRQDVVANIESSLFEKRIQPLRRRDKTLSIV